MSNEEDEANQATNNTNNDDYYEEIDENFYENKSNVLAYCSEDAARAPRPSLKQPCSSKTASLKPRSDAAPRLSKIRTVPSIRYTVCQEALAIDDFKLFKKQPGDRNRAANKENDSLNNLEITETESAALLVKADAKSDRSRANQSEQSNRTYEEIMQTGIVDYTELKPGRRTDQNKGHYRISSGNSNASRRNRSSSSSTYSATNRLSMTGATAGGSGSRRQISSSGATGLMETASMLGADEYDSYSAKGCQAKRDRISYRLRQLDRFDTYSAADPPTLPNHPTDLNEIITLSNTDTPAKPATLDDTDLPDLIELTQKTYTWQLTSTLAVHVPFDHFSLLAMLDRNHTPLELALSILIATLVSVCTALILNEHIYDDLLLVLFCFIAASCHYSLLKSVQPDSSSPIHGFNSLTALSRPIYFCLICTTILLLRLATSNQNQPALTAFLGQFTIYSYPLHTAHCLLVTRFLETALLFFPLVFTFGLCPQINTFLLCVLEQLDMLLFGGTAMNNLCGAFLSLARSLLTALVLTLTLLGAVHSVQPGDSDDHLVSKSVVFSVFCAMLVLASYFLSRQTSDLLLYVQAVREFVVEAVLVACQCDSETTAAGSGGERPTGGGGENGSEVKDVKSVYLSVPDSSMGSLQASLSSGESGSLGSVAG